ncbi:MAG: papain-like cysteine protease family protein [Terriglobia bacterium]|jgi:peptidoglycan hydrolase-like protein with peptidoglycan-binding domain
MAVNPILSLGAQGPGVARLQQLLNSKMKPSPNLVLDGRFGHDTQAAVERFQAAHWLSKDGIAGPCVWCTLEGRDKYVILHNVNLVAQWTDSTCWSAALSMLLGGAPACMSPGRAAVSPQVRGDDGLYHGGGLYNDSILSRPENTRAFADSYGLTLLHATSWMPDGLAGQLRAHGPLMMNMLWNAPRFVMGKGSPGHMVIIAGIRGDGTPDGTTIRIYDPWPIGKGSKYSLSYGPFMGKMPTATYQLYYK